MNKNKSKADRDTLRTPEFLLAQKVHHRILMERVIGRKGDTKPDGCCGQMINYQERDCG